MPLNKKTLFISHNASMSGAPYVLLYLLQWLKKNENYSFDVLLLNDGPLRKDFIDIADHVYVPSEILRDHKHGILDRVKRKLKIDVSEEKRMLKVCKRIKVDQYDVIYGNTILSFSWLLYFKETFNSKVVCAIHELKTNMESRYTREFLLENLHKIDLLIAGSEAVSINLTQRYLVPASIIKVVHAFIHQHVKPAGNKNILNITGVQKGQFIIGAVGNPEWRKGTDLFIHLALCFKRNFPDFNFHLIWVGGKEDEFIIKNLKSDIEKCDLNQHFTFLESSRDYLDYMNQFDIFAMLSREDPFPLVSLEASYLEKPIVMFEGTGGTAELLKNGGGIIVPYLAIEELAAQIYSLYEDENLRKQMGSILKNEVVVKYNSDVLCKKVFSILETV